MIWSMLPLTWRLGIIGAVLVAMVGGASALYFKIRHDAVEQERAKVEEQKKRAVERANEAREKVRELCPTPSACSLPDDWFRDD